MISMIAAMGENRTIGKDGKMPWHLPNDLKFFKQTTSGHPVIMGRTTFDSIGKPLPNRKNIVLTRNTTFSAEGVEVIHSIDEMDKYLSQDEEVFVIGGATLYEQCLPIATKIYLTVIHEEFHGDTFFPAFDEKEWKIISKVAGTVDEKNKHPHTFVIYERIAK